MNLGRAIKIEKKAIFFTLSTIFIVIVFLASFYSINVLTKSSTASRIRTMNSFILSAERDTERALNINGLRSILAMQDRMISNGVFIANASSAFSESFFNGSIEGQSFSFLESSTFYNWQNTLIQKASEFNININLSSPILLVYQEDPWHITLELDFKLIVEDSTKIAKWDIDEKIKAAVSIEGFEDPLYIIYTSGNVANIINKTPYEENYVSGGSITNLSIHSLNSLYAENSNAPSFLMRLEGKTNPSNYGIESMVNLQKFQQSGLIVYDRSVIDYVYFSGTSTTNYVVSGMPSWFKIDSEHLEKYQVEGLV